jgi:P4 family phage/plasmid primase-like protien
MAVTHEILKWFYDHDYDLIPLHAGDKGKRPLHNEWTSRDYNAGEIQEFAYNNHNIGCRMGERDLVLDVDMKPGGLDSLERLQKDVTIDADTYPSTLTGGGGYHFFMRLTKDQAAKWGTKFKETLRELPGLEFKGLGRQLVIPGSIHPETKEPYEFDDFSRLDCVEVPAPPDELLQRLLLTVDVQDPTDSEIAPWTPEHLKAVLTSLPVEEYGSNSAWFPIMAAAYHATAGLGIEEFVEWSTGDPNYETAGPNIRARWASLASATPTKRTAGTLYHELIRRGKPIPGGMTAADEFQDVPFPDSKIKPTLAEVRATIDVISPGTPNSDVKDVLDDICYLEPIDRYDALAALARQSGRPRAILDQTLKLIINSKQPVETSRPIVSADAGDEITAAALDRVFDKGQNIINLQGQFWAYEKNFWIPVDKDVVGKKMLYVVREWIRKHHTKRSVASYTDEAMKTLTREVASSEDLLRLTVEPLPVINTLSGEVWIDNETGDHELRKHSPKSYLTTCLDTAYDPDAVCVLFDATLKDIFEPLEDRAKVIKHIWELIGYTIQPRKNLPHWWLFYGGGANGKTVLIKVIEALLGQAALNCEISSFSKSNNHAVYDLVGKLALIDEDVEIGTRLPGAILKKITENKRMLANPKMQKAFPFVAATSVIMAANNYPRTNDISAGLRRRACVIPFLREFQPKEQDPDRANKIIKSELPGVLNKALKALRTLRRRRAFLKTDSIKSATGRWLSEANPVVAFFEETCMVRASGSISCNKLWMEYQYWTQEQSITRLSKYKFMDAIKSLGYPIRPGSGNRAPRFMGCVSRPVEEREII